MTTDTVLYDLCDEFEELITIIDVDTYEILYLNRNSRELLGDTPWRDEKCYRVLQGKEEPCSFCPFLHLTYDKFYVWEYYNETLKRHVIVKDKLFDYQGRVTKLEISIDITEKENLSEVVRDKLLREETLVNCISTVSCAGSLEEGISWLLHMLADYYGADRAYIIESSEDRRYLSNTYEWCMEGVEPQAQFLQKVEITRFQRWYEAFQCHSRIVCKNLNELRESFSEEYKELKRQSVTSLYAAPMVMNGETIGFIGLDNPKEEIERRDLLEPLSYFLANEIYKRRLLKRLQNADLDIKMQNERFCILQEISREITYEYTMAEDVMEYRIGNWKHTRTVRHFFEEQSGFLLAEDIPAIKKSFWDGVEGDGRQELELRVSFEEGKYEWYKAVYGIVFDSEHRPVRTIGKLFNIDDLKSRQRDDELTLKQMQAAINRTYALVLALDMGRDEYRKLYDRGGELPDVDEKGSYTKLIRLLKHHIHPDDRQVALDIQSSGHMAALLLDREVVSFDIRLEGKRKGWRWYELTLTPLNESDTVLFLLKGCDSKKAIEENLRNALKNAEIAGQAKTDFLSRMSHDIRTPLNGIIGMTKIARADAADREKVEECLQKINTASEYLLMLVNNVLDMRQIESGKAQLMPESMSINGMLGELAEIYQPQMEARQIRFTVENRLKLDRILADKLKITQVLSNLLSNAGKYVQKGGDVRLRVEQKKIENNRVFLHFAVQDNGAGMSEAFMEKLFEPFEREKDAEIQANMGSGLGLSICKNLVAMMDGHIRVTSRKGSGSLFEVELPVEADRDFAEKGKESGEEEAFDFTGRKALLAEDNSLNAEIAEFFLTQRGIQVDIVENGKEALERFSESAPGYYDVILMDIMMPVMDGLEAADKIRGLTRADAGSVPIIAMTANAFKEDVTRALSHGMNDHIAKPLDDGRVYSVLAYWLGNSH